MEYRPKDSRQSIQALNDLSNSERFRTMICGASDIIPASPCLYANYLAFLILGWSYQSFTIANDEIADNPSCTIYYMGNKSAYFSPVLPHMIAALTTAVPSLSGKNRKNITIACLVYHSSTLRLHSSFTYLQVRGDASPQGIGSRYWHCSSEIFCYQLQTPAEYQMVYNWMNSIAKCLVPDIVTTGLYLYGNYPAFLILCWGYQSYILANVDIADTSSCMVFSYG